MAAATISINVRTQQWKTALAVNLGNIVYYPRNWSMASAAFTACGSFVKVGMAIDTIATSLIKHKCNMARAAIHLLMLPD